MKTTIELPEVLLQSAKQLAERRKWTMKMVLEDSLRCYLREAEAEASPVSLKHTVFGSAKKKVRDTRPWNEIRDLIYGLPDSKQ